MKKQSPTFEAESAQPDYVRELLEAGRDAGLNDPAVHGYDVEAGLARHMAQVQTGAPLPQWAQELVASSGGAGAGAATAAKLATAKLVAGVTLAVIAAGTIAALVIGAPEKNTRIAPPPVAPAPPAAAPAPLGDQNAHDENEARAAGDAVELEIAPIVSRAKRDVNNTPSAQRAPDVESKPASSRTQSTKSLDALIENVGKQQASKGHVELVAPRDTVARTESQATAADRSEHSATAAVTPAPAPVVDDARLEREMGMLAVAQRVLKTDPERALRLARQGEQEFAGSMFTQERQQVLLLALIELGRIGEAKRLALPYLKRYPNGPFSDRLRSALAAAKSEN
jgi:hypothetical protein